MDNWYILDERLKDLLFESKMSAEELSKLINIEQSTIYKWWTNNSIPNLDNLIKLANVFECSIDYLIGKSNEIYKVKSKPLLDFNIQLKLLIEKHNTTMYNICKTKNISKSVFRNWLSGKSQPLIDSIIKLSDYFDCSIDYLVGRE